MSEGAGSSSTLLCTADRIPQRPGPLMDYVLTPYEPRASLEGKLHSMSVLFYFLRKHGMLESMKPILKALYVHLGPNHIVWGIKYSSGKPAIELYFYNHCRNKVGNPMAISTLVKVLEPHLKVRSLCDESLPYIMCSLELCPERLQSGVSEGFRLYLSGRHEEDGYDGISYLVTASERIRENEYCFFYSPTDPYLVGLIDDSAVVSSSRDRLFPDRYTDCYSICFSKKRESVALYYSRITTGQLLHFAGQHFSDDLAALLEEEKGNLDHLMWDIGYDVQAELSPPGGELDIHKVGIYGFL